MLRVLARHDRNDGTVVAGEIGARQASLNSSGTGIDDRKPCKVSAAHIRAGSGKAAIVGPLQVLRQLPFEEQAR